MMRWRFKILIDGECPLCRSEGEFLRWLDGGRRRLIIEDIAAPGFDPRRYGLTAEQVMGQIHGVLPHGKIVKGMEVFRQAYAAVGWGWMLAPTAWPGVRTVADAAYRWFARNRLRITRRAEACATGRCRLPQA
jgi:predicted DCC family thiol-disulfide oxidoreductase YuxK